MPENIQEHMHALIAQHGSALTALAAFRQQPKTQQTLNNVEVYLSSLVFYHGQLYVAISQVTSSANIKIFNR
jgi:hypothetical protein